jgi:uncharacterized membrane protein YesL
MAVTLQKVLTTVYNLIIISFYFWIYIIRGMFIYSFIPAIVTLMEVSRLIYHLKSDEEIRRLYQSKFQLYKQHKGSSFVVSFLLIILATALYFVNGMDGSLQLILYIVLLYMIILLLLVTSNTSHQRRFAYSDMKHAFIVGFLDIIKKPQQTLYLLAVFTICIGIGIWNLVAFLAFVPALYGISSIYIYNNTERE